VRAEGRGGEARVVGQVRVARVVVEGVARGDGARNFGRPDLDLVLPRDLRLGPVPFSIRAGDGELFEFVAVTNLQPRAHVVECENHLQALGLRAAKGGAGRGQLAPVDFGERPARHAAAHVELVLRVDVVRLADVDGDDEAGVSCGERGAALRLADVAPGFVGGFRLRVAVVRQLHD